VSPTDRLTRADRALHGAALMLIVLPLLVYLGRRRIGQAVAEIEPLEQERDQATHERDRLRSQLDGALEALHEAKGESKAEPGIQAGGSKDQPGNAALDTQGSLGSDESPGAS
jgi:hypothetical protein